MTKRTVVMTQLMLAGDVQVDPQPLMWLDTARFKIKEGLRSVFPEFSRAPYSVTYRLARV